MSDYEKVVQQSVWEAKDLRITRMAALNTAVALLTANQVAGKIDGVTTTAVLELAETFVNYVYKKQ